MKILELLEKLTADVHVNFDKKLYVITNLVQHEFGPRFDKITGGCLASQMIFSMASAANVDPEILIKALNNSKVTAGVYGTTLEDLYKVFNNKPIRVSDKDGGKKLTFKLSVETPTLEAAIQDVKSGQPIIFIPSTHIQDALDNYRDQDGIAKISNNQMLRNLTDQSTFHAYLLIGYDRDGYLILREMRHTYAYKGYIKLSVRALKKNPKAYKFITIVVDDVKQEKL